MNKTETRIEAIKIIYEINLRQIEPHTAISEKEGLSLAIIDLINGVFNHKEEIDNKISSCLKNYKINRLNIVDLAIIELATYEMMYTDTPFQVVINEALNITRAYTLTDDNNSVKFNNKLLDNIHKSLEA